MPWAVTQTTDSITWNSETLAQNQNANAIRFGTMYNFRFDADQPPQNANATVGFFKTGSPMTVAIQAPAGGGTPTPTATPSANRHGDCNTQAHSDTKDRSFAEAASNSATAPLAVLRQTEQKRKRLLEIFFSLCRKP